MDNPKVCFNGGGKGTAIHLEEIDRDENSVTARTVEGICHACNGSGVLPMTNADRIRAMTDEELANWLADMWDCHCCSEDERLGDNHLLMDEHCDQRCEQHCLEWLQQPAEEG